ncbi:response regulator [Caulobacter sp. SLTY]|uniref:response regulator n=1 Tax=Caulobacter sp. SLTY TaxID=2683262 RepID=UPI001411DD70|nr:response regulator [Caulobacter sp. SLTY]
MDDDPLIVELLMTRLHFGGFEPLKCTDGVSLLERLPHVRLDALVLDVNMPRMDGFTVLSLLAQSGRLKRLPTMMLTARNQAVDVDKALSLGAMDFMAKPIQTDVFLRRIRRLCRRIPVPAPEPQQGPAEDHWVID